jgi:hypothetical protein
VYIEIDAVQDADIFVGDLGFEALDLQNGRVAHTCLRHGSGIITIPLIKNDSFFQEPKARCVN